MRLKIREGSFKSRCTQHLNGLIGTVHSSGKGNTVILNTQVGLVYTDPAWLDPSPPPTNQQEALSKAS